MSATQVKNSSFATLGISVGLFLFSAAFLQWVRRGDTRSSDADEQYELEEEEFRRWYRSRRLRDRLSYDNVQDLVQQPPAASKPRPFSPYDRAVSDLSDDGFFYDTSDDDLGDPTERPQPNMESGRANRKRGVERKTKTKGEKSEKRTSTANDAAMRRTSDFHPNADFDFHPKNRNW